MYYYDHYGFSHGLENGLSGLLASLQIVIIAVIVIAIIIQLVAATQFEFIAEMKGHTGSEILGRSKYFWFCLLLGPVGWAMVIALPDRKAEFPERSAAVKATIKDDAPTVSGPATDNDLPDL